MNDGTARQEAAWQYEASRFIRGVSWVFELVDTKLHDNGTRPVYTGCFMNSVTARHEIAWQCDVFRFMPGVSMHDGTARHELVSTRSYDYLEILNAWIAGLNGDRIMILSHVLYVRSEKWHCVCLCKYSNSRVPWQDFHEIFKLDKELRTVYKMYTLCFHIDDFCLNTYRIEKCNTVFFSSCS